MREIVAEQAGKTHASSAPASVHYAALALLAVAAFGLLALVMAVDRIRKRKR